MTCTPLPAEFADLVASARTRPGPLVVLTGAGISAESGIPTFRGPGGYWTAKAGEHASEKLRPEALATWAAFSRMPEEVWRFYLYRRSVCRRAEPNAAHRALVELERALQDRFLLVTQNVDGLHRRAGSSEARTYEIHGNLNRMRCPNAPGEEKPRMIPEALLDWPRERAFDDEARRLLRCCPGGTLARPHVLFFDECYDEATYRFRSSLQAAQHAAMLMVVGTSGQTNLPDQMVRHAAARETPLVVCNLDESPFTRLARDRARGLVLRGKAAQLVPAMAEAIARSWA